MAGLDPHAVAFEEQGGRRVGALESFALVSPLAPGGGQIVEKRIDLSLPPDVHARVLRAGLPILRSLRELSSLEDLQQISSKNILQGMFKPLIPLLQEHS